VSKEIPSIAASKQVRPFDLHWLPDPMVAVNVLVLGVSVLLLTLAWLNAAVTVLTGFLAVLGIIARFLQVCARWTFGRLYDLSTQLREWHRQKVFAAEMAAYVKQTEIFIAAKPNAAELGPRLKLFNAAATLDSRIGVVKRYMGLDGILDGSRFDDAGHDEDNSEYHKIWRAYGYANLWWCCKSLRILAHLASSEFVSNDAWKLYDRVEQCVRAYEDRPEDRLLAIIQKTSLPRKPPLSDGERQWAQEAVRARLKKIASREMEIREVERQLHQTALKLVPPREDGTHTYGDFLEAERAAEVYFTMSESTDAKFPGTPPLQGSKDSQIVTYLLGLLQRAAGKSE
jgi:hypothetical protein